MNRTFECPQCGKRYTANVNPMNTDLSNWPICAEGHLPAPCVEVWKKPERKKPTT